MLSMSKEVPWYLVCSLSSSSAVVFVGYRLSSYHDHGMLAS
jgi:hypothetical protein